MSEQVERKLLELLEHPTHSPYGNPIPGLEGLGDRVPVARFTDGVVNLVNLVQDTADPVGGTVRRLGEPVQYEPELLEQLQSAGVVPGASGMFAARGDYVLATIDGRDEDALELPAEVAQHIYVGTSAFAD